MGCADLDQHVNGIETCVLCKGPRDDLECYSKGLDGELFLATDRCRVLAEPERELGLGCATTGDNLLVLDTDNAECVVDSALELVDDVLSATLDDDGNRLRVLALLDKGHLLSGDLALFDKTRMAEFFLADRVDGRDEAATGCPGKLLHVALLDTADGEDTGLCKVVLCDIIDALLAEHYVRAARDNLFDDILDHALLFIEECL